MMDCLSVSRIQNHIKSNHIGKGFLFCNIYDAVVRNDT